MMTKEQWVTKIQESEEFAAHVYEAIVEAAIQTTGENDALEDALASALQKYNK